MMNNVKKVPEIRFKGYDNVWYKNKLSELCDVRDGTHDSPKYLDKGYYFITSKNVKKGYINFDEINFISKEDYDNINKRSKVDIGDILFGMIGTIGNIAIVRKEPNYAIKNVALIKDIQKVYNYFNYYFLQSPNIENQLDSGLDGGTQKFISLKSIRGLDVIFPKYEEQSQIGNFFKNLDEKLELEKEKHEKLISFKKTMFEDMFPKKGKKVPKVRFKGFDDEWENFKIEDIGDVRTGKTPQTSDSSNYSDNGILFITPTDIKSNITRTTERCLSNKGSLLSTIVEPGTTLVTCIASIGKNTLIEERSAFNQQINSITPYNSNPYFIYTLSYKWSEKMRIMAATGTMQIVNKKEFSKINTLIPSPEEQALIGNFFKNLDEKIELSEQKIQKIENFKKAMLDKMFV